MELKAAKFLFKTAKLVFETSQIRLLKIKMLFRKAFSKLKATKLIFRTTKMVFKTSLLQFRTPFSFYKEK